ncbi:MAG: hypothetical protein ACOCPX_03905 [Halapricum sp.]
MTDRDAQIEQFFDAVDTAFKEYDQGYADADATLRVLRSHLEEFRKSVEE